MDLHDELVLALGREGLDGQIELGGSAGSDGLVTGDGQRSGIGHVVVSAPLEGKRLLGEVNVIRADDILAGREGNLIHLKGGARRVSQVDGNHRGDMLHGDDRRLVTGDVLRNAVNRKVLSGEMGHAVQAGLGLLFVGLGADGNIAGTCVRRGLDVAAIRIKQIPVIRIGSQFGGTFGVVVRGIIDLELGIRGILRGTGGSHEHVQCIAVLPLGAHPVIDGTGGDVAQDDLDVAAVEAFHIGFLVTAHKGKGGGQTREE